MSANLSSGSKWGLFLVTALVLPRPLLATSMQDTVRVGDSSVSGEFIRPFRIQWIAIPRTAEGATLATFTVDESVEIVDGNLLKFVQAWNDTPRQQPLHVSARGRSGYNGLQSFSHRCFTGRSWSSRLRRQTSYRNVC